MISISWVVRSHVARRRSDFRLEPLFVARNTTLYHVSLPPSGSRMQEGISR